MKLSITNRTRVLPLLLTAFLLIWSLITASLTYAQGDSSKKPIRLVSGDYYPEIVLVTEAQNAQKDVFDGQYFKLIQFIQIPGDMQRKSWADDGLYLVDYLHDDTYFAVIDQNFDLNRLASDIITIIDVADIFKKEAGFDLQKNRKTTNKFVASYYATLDAQKVVSDLRSRGVDIENQRDYSRQLDIIIKPAQLDEIIALPYIQFIGPELPEPELEAYYKNSTGRANYLNSGYNGLTYNGDGVVIAIGEGNTVGNHIDFRGRLTELSSGSPGSHKIGSMRNAGGGGNLDPTEMNNAAGATLLSVGGGPDYAALYASHNLRFTNHSYGYGVGGGYNSATRNHDLRTASHPYHIVSYSSGNVGGDTGYAPYNGFSGWANVTGAVKQNKNHFAIRNLGGDDTILTWGSKGPAYDGRILPQLTIEGWEGTSYASPKVVGLMAVLAQVYKAKNGAAEAPANLLRAVLMNTADDMDDPGPDFKTGYGRPNARRAYNVLNNSQFISSTISNGITNTHTIIVPPNTKQVRVMLMWPDVAASVNADPAIVNNLNLLVTDPPGTTSYNPWVLDHTPNPINLDLPATRQVDNLNTMEQVTVDNPASGSWTVKVNGASVPLGPQSYYIVYEFLMDELHMGFPLKDVRLKAGDSYYLKWDSYGGSGTFTLTYQLDGGSWVNIVSGHDASSRSYEWATPAVITGIHTVKVRVQRGVLTATSDINYIGDVPQNFTLDWACADTVKLSWGAVNGATSYKVYRLGLKYMQEVTTSITFDGTSAIISGLSTTEDEYFAVSAVTGANEGLRTNALTKTVGDYNCFNVKTTVASEVDRSNITLNGLVNPHNSTLTNVHFEYGPTIAYGTSMPNIPTSATGHTEEAVTSTIASTLSSRNDILHYRLALKKDGLDVYGDDQEIRLAPGNDFTFDGTDDYLNLGSADQIVGANPRSIAAWAYTESFNNGGIFQAGATGTTGGDFSLRTLTTDERWRVQLWGSGEFDITLSGSKNAWHHYVLTYDGTTLKLYYDGYLAGSSSPTLNTLAQDIYLGRWNNDYFDGKIDEVSYWNKALTEAEIRDLMHQPLDGNEANLINYFNMDGKSGAAFDLVTGKEGQLTGGITKTTSAAPFGLGTEFTATEANGAVTFSGTDLAANYSTQSGATVIVSKIEIEPNVTSGFPGSSTIFNNQYWVAHRHGSGTFSAVVTFTLSEDLTALDQSTPGQIHLYSRDKGSDGSWSFLAAANSVDPANEQAVFNGLTAFNQQFMLARNTDPFINASVNSLPFRNIKMDCNYQQYAYQLAGINLTANVDVTPPAGFLVSTNASSGFSTTLSLIPGGGAISETIYVRFTPASTGTVSGGDVVNNSTGATTVTVNIPQFTVYDIEDYATRAMTFDGSNDYLEVQNFDWNPNNIFSVEWWLKPNTHSNWNQQVGNSWGNFLFHTNSSGQISAGVANNSWSRIDSASGALALNEWQHFAFTLNGGNAKLYRNGELLGEQASSSGISSNWDHFDIGKNGGSTINGQIDEFRIWSTARTQQEIQDNMHNVLAGNESGLKLYLQFNAETGDVVDFSDQCYAVNSNNGPGRTISTAPVGTVGEFVDTQTSTFTGDVGKRITVTIASTTTFTDYLGIYRTGSGTQHYSGDTFPAGVTWRADIFWGVQEYGAVTATLVIDYSNVGGIDDPAAIKLLKRTNVVSDWTDVSGDFVHDPLTRTFTKIGVTDFSEFSIGSAPTAINDEYNMPANSVLNISPSGVLSNDSYIEIGTTALTDTLPITGTLVFTTDGSFQYTPPIGYSGVVTFTYHARDGLFDSNIASVTITVIAAADLSIGKSAQATPNTSAANYHGLITYTVTLTNSGGLDATATLFTDTLPATKVDFARFISPPTPGNAAENSDIITWSGTVTANSVITFSYVVTHGGNYSDTFSNRAEFLHPTTSQSDTVSATVTIEVLSADLGLSKTVSNNNPREEETIIYTIVLSNIGSHTAHNVVVSDTLPSALNLAQAGATEGSYSSPTWSVGSLDKNEVQTLTLTATVKSGTAGQTITNTAEISASDATDPMTANNTDTANLTVQEADLDLAKFITGPDDGSQLLKLSTADTGQRITYTLIITNNGSDTLPAGSVVSDTLPSSLTILAPGSVSGTIANVGNLVTWTLPQLVLNEVTTATITATVKAGSASQTISNRASINSATQGDTITANNSSTATLTVNGADLHIGKSVMPLLPLEGDTITYTIVVTNIAGDTSPNIVISDVLPTGITYGGLVSGSPSEGSYTAGSVGVWSGITLTLNSSATLVFTATVDGGTGGNTLVNTTAISNSSTEDPNSANNTASASVTVATFDLAISKSSVRDGAAITYTLIVSNIGSSTASGAIISDAVPSGMVGNTWYWSCTASNGATCPTAGSSGDINETSGSIPVNGQLLYNITATLSISTATIINTATVTSLNGLGDSDPSNNSATNISSASGDIYLPIICNACVTGSDLIIVPGTLTATNSSITLQIQNSGNAATSGDFWVDVYFNPTQTPALNKAWQSIASAGAAWGVTQSLAAGEIITLTVGGTYYDASKSSSSFPSGATVYAYVDSINYATTYGAVLEFNENNNLSGPVTSTAGAAGPIAMGGSSISSESLPRR